jgi:hypothetical protein
MREAEKLWNSDGTVSTAGPVHPSYSDILMRRQFEAAIALYIETSHGDTNLIIESVRLFSSESGLSLFNLQRD